MQRVLLVNRYRFERFTCLQVQLLKIIKRHVETSIILRTVNNHLSNKNCPLIAVRYFQLRKPLFSLYYSFISYSLQHQVFNETLLLWKAINAYTFYSIFRSPSKDLFLASIYDFPLKTKLNTHKPQYSVAFEFKVY